MHAAEIKWLLLGEKMGDGGLLYVDIWDDTAPLAAGVYWLLDFLFGRSAMAHHIVSLLLVWVQSFLFNALLLQNKAYNESSYIPALVYITLMNLFFDFNSLSPVLMSLTFILLAINNLFKRIDNQTQDSFFLNTGIYLGLACLFYLPMLGFFLATVLSLLLFTGSLFRRYMLLLYGFGLPWLFTWMYFYWNNGHKDFYIQFLQSVFFVEPTNWLPSPVWLVLTAAPLLFAVLAIYVLVVRARYVNFQVRFQYVMLFMLLLAAPSLLVAKARTPYQLMVFVPMLAFFISHYFLLSRRRLLAEVQFLLFFVVIVGLNLGYMYNWLQGRNWLDTNDYVLEQTYEDKSLVTGKRILITGNDLTAYQDAHHATQYLNWQLASLHFNNVGYYDNLTDVYINFSDDLPEVIVDQAQVMPPIFEKMPLLAKQYVLLSNKQVYVLKTVQ